jgi:ketosteroid isomerase-like protein
MTDPRRGEAALLAANEAFYRAFAARDIAAMETLWSDTAFAACIHPGWNALRGRELVLASWRSILGSAEAPRVVCANPTAHLLGEAGFVVCEERVGAAVLIATNVFVRDGGVWRMVHHHAAPVAQDAFVVVPGDQEDDRSPLN